MSDGSDSAREAKAKADKAEAEARSAQIAADKAQHELDQLGGEEARLSREAARRKAQADADKAAADARSAQVSALVPDLGEVERGETKVSGDRPLYSSVLAHRALDGAVQEIVEEVVRHVVEGEPVLITDDADLASSDAAYGEVSDGLERLIEAADEALPAPARAENAPEEKVAMASIGLASIAGAVTQAVAGVVPPVLSLLAARRTVASHAVTVDGTATKAAVAGALAERSRPARLDDFRLVPRGRLVEREQVVRERRGQLVGRKAGLEQDRVHHDLLRSSEQGRIDQLTKLIDASTDPGGEAVARWDQAREQARANRDRAAAAAKDASVAVAGVDAVLSSIDAFLAAIHAVAAGESRSAMVRASLREQLRDPEGDLPEITRVLFLGTVAGSADQLFADRPLWADDKFHAIGSVSVSYWLLDVTTGNIVAAGVAKGSAELRGKLGSGISITASPD